MLVRALKLHLTSGETLVSTLKRVDHGTPIPAAGLHVRRLLSKFNRVQLASVAR